MPEHDMNELHHYPERGFFTARTLAYTLSYMNNYGRKIFITDSDGIDREITGWHVVDDRVELIW